MKNKNTIETGTFHVGWSWKVFLVGYGYYPGDEASSATLYLGWLSLTIAWAPGQ